MTDLDFSGLMNIGADNKAPTTNTDKEELSYELNQMKTKYTQVLIAYKKLQENKQSTNDAKTTFIRNLEAGDKEIKDLLVDAIEIIGTATHDTAFTNASKRNLNDNY